MLEKDRFLRIKNLAKEIRKENDKLFKEFENESVADAIKEKNEFVEAAIDAMNNQFDSGDNGKEERQVFRANILIPDDVEFFQSYSVDKNIRNLMNKYAVGIEDVMSKITELNVYGKYVDIFDEDEKKNDSAKEETVDDYDFVDEMIDLSSKEAESLLDEIEGLSKEVNNLDIPNGVISEEPVKSQTKISTPKASRVARNEARNLKNDEEFENISGAVLGFIDESNKMRVDLENATGENSHLKDELNKVNLKASELKAELSIVNSKKESLELDLKKAADENSALNEKILKMKDENNSLLEEIRISNDDRNTLKDQVIKYVNEIADLKKNNLECADELKKCSEEKKSMSNEIASLKDKLAVLEEKAAKSSELIQKIYNCIPK